MSGAKRPALSAGQFLFLWYQTRMNWSNTNKVRRQGNDRPPPRATRRRVLQRLHVLLTTWASRHTPRERLHTTSHGLRSRATRGEDAPNAATPEVLHIPVAFLFNP